MVQQDLSSGLGDHLPGGTGPSSPSSSTKIQSVGQASDEDGLIFWHGTQFSQESWQPWCSYAITDYQYYPTWICVCPLHYASHRGSVIS